MVLSRHSLCPFVTAVFVASAVLAQDELQTRIDKALAAARPALLGHLDAAAKSGTPGELALVCLAAVHDGVPLDDPVRVRAFAKLAKAVPAQTYDIALRLLVLQAATDVPDHGKLVDRDGKELLAHRSRDGGFQYDEAPVGWDLSNTQYGALGLRAAAALGVQVDRRTWQRLADLVGEQQDSYGGFGYGVRHGNANDGCASMTAAGISVLAICRQALAGNDAQDRELAQRIQRGWLWFSQHGSCIGSPRERWSYYFHYGLERAAILCDVVEIGNKLDWYRTGAGMLVEDQLPGGGWKSLTDGSPGGHLDRGRGDAVPTSFAVLFLRRKFQKAPLSGPITPRVVNLANLGPASKADDVDACAALLVQRGKAALAEVVKAMRSEVVTQRRAAAKALIGLAGSSFDFDPEQDRDSDAARAAVRRAELWVLQNR